MTCAIYVLHWLCGIVVIAEALNKLERTAPCRRGLSLRERVVSWLKAAAWMLLAMGGGQAVATPFLRLQPPSFGDLCMALGFTVLIIRTRIKEG